MSTLPQSKSRLFREIRHLYLSSPPDEFWPRLEQLIEDVDIKHETTREVLREALSNLYELNRTIDRLRDRLRKS